ncbi:tyrosine-protein phosphatase [Paenarthrobacter nitroguajacolicus]|uniref:tyrosine-protein phosphatase n=1 Tax=Paenarthrobacter nitroguajacolicus TaxID=211146 RepID=UPI003AD7F74D
MIIQPEEFRNPAVQADLLKFVPSEIVENAVIFVAGSLVHGYGNATSDIDIIAIHRETDVGSRAESIQSVVKVAEGLDVHVGEYRGVRVDLEVVQWEKISSVATQLREGGSASTVPEYLRVSLNNLKNGVPLVRSGEFENLRDSFPWATYTRMVTLENASRFQSTSEDASGGILGKDLGPAMLASKRALDNAADALLASLGNTNYRTKWRLRLLESVAGSEPARRYLEAQLEPSLQTLEVIQRAKQRLRLGQSFLLDAHSALTAQTSRRDAALLARTRRPLVIPGHPNAWDIGGLPVGDNVVKSGVLYRAGSSEAVDAQDLDQHAIVTVVDLKNEDEPHFPIVDAGKYSIRQVSLPSREFSTDTLVEVIRLLEQSDGAVLIHCARGRDRTGLMIACILRIIGASKDAITADFMNSVRGWDAVAPESERARRSYVEIESEFRSNLGQSNIEQLARDAGLTQASVDALKRKILTAADE